ncbi:CRTAC1 family protein [Streptosporangium sp. OZ121]|uniref:CRTAC1 family protein n=1 Tax=Streptosporangium sp. OZ121 TaxID=3444183 RepID=UPI003F7B0589
MKGRIKVRAAQLCALLLTVAGWHFARLPDAAPATATSPAPVFAFQKLPLNTATTKRDIRVVAPAYEKIRHWISSVGAAVALADLDANGRADDTCLVDPRDDSVTLLPAPGTESRYAPVTLAPTGLAYNATMAPMGCVPGDYNEDGRMDALVYHWGRSPILFLRKADPMTSAAFAPQELVQPYQVWNTNAVSLADFDGDGHTDIVVGNYFPDGARVLDPTARQPELQMQDSMSAGYNAGRNRVLLFQGARGGTTPQARFTEAAGALSAEMANGWTLALGAQDLNADGLADLYVANDFGPDRLLRNISTPGNPRFQLMDGIRHLTTPKSKALGRDSFKGMGVTFTDLNQDDVPDMVVSNITEEFALLESNFAWISARKNVLDDDGTAYYDDHSEPLGLSRAGWGWDIKAGDFAGDGQTQILQATGFLKGTTNRWPELQELAMTNDGFLVHPGAWPEFGPGDDVSGDDPDRFFVRDSSGRFQDIAAQLGVDNPGPTRGMALADVDHDGRLDFAVANQWRQSYFYRNTRTTQHPFLGLQLLRPATACGGPATSASTPAIGATALVRSGAAGTRTGQVHPANGHGGVSSPELLFALGAAATPAKVTVAWRDACGVRHSTDLTLTPGWHTVLLGTDGTAREITR